MRTSGVSSARSNSKEYISGRIQETRDTKRSFVSEN